MLWCWWALFNIELCKGIYKQRHQYFCASKKCTLLNYTRKRDIFEFMCHIVKGQDALSNPRGAAQAFRQWCTWLAIHDHASVTAVWDSNTTDQQHDLGLYSLSGKTSYRQISWSLEAARLCVIMIVSHWNLTGISAALLPSCLSNCRAIEKVYSRISRLRDFTRSCGKTSYGLVNRGPEYKCAAHRCKYIR